MLTLALSVIQAPSRMGIHGTDAFVIALVLGAVGLVFWASRPSVIAKYSADRTHPAADKEPRD